MTNITTAATIANALGGRKVGSGWMASCPAHDDRKPSLSIRDSDDGKVMVYCHSGCDQRSVIAALQSRGLLYNYDGHRRFTRPGPRTTASSHPGRDEAARSVAALAIWESAKPALGTLVETYLASRGLHLPLMPTLRFHAGLKHPSGGTWPAMVALVTEGADGTPVAIHRTYLTRDGRSKAPVAPSKMMLGPCRGGAVRLGPVGDRLMIAEGIESALSAVQATGEPAWAALSTSGLRSLDLPREVRDVIVLADGDAPGEAAAQDCAWRWKREGRRVRIARPPRGVDFNDLLQGRVSIPREGAA